MFNLFTPIELSSKAPRWSANVKLYTKLFGFSPFADLFVCSEDQRCFAVITTEYPEVVQLKSENMLEFTEQFLGNDKVQQDFFRIDEYKTLCLKYGKLETGECFYPIPYRSIGGTGSIESYVKGDVWVHLDLYGQTIGL